MPLEDTVLAPAGGCGGERGVAAGGVSEAEEGRAEDREGKEDAENHGGAKGDFAVVDRCCIGGGEGLGVRLVLSSRSSFSKGVHGHSMV